MYVKDSSHVKYSSHTSNATSPSSNLAIPQNLQPPTSNHQPPGLSPRARCTSGSRCPTPREAGGTSRSGRGASACPGTSSSPRDVWSRSVVVGGAVRGYGAGPQPAHGPVLRHPAPGAGQSRLGDRGRGQLGLSLPMGQFFATRRLEQVISRRPMQPIP